MSAGSQASAVRGLGSGGRPSIAVAVSWNPLRRPRSTTLYAVKRAGQQRFVSDKMDDILVMHHRRLLSPGHDCMSHNDKHDLLKVTPPTIRSLPFAHLDRLPL